MKTLNIYVIFLLALLVISCEKSDADNAVEGKLIMVAGQSNAVGVGDKNLSVKTEQGTAYEYVSENDEFIYLSDPVGSSHMGFQKAEDGSFIPALAKELNEQTSEKIYVVQAAKGGSSCHTQAETNNWGTWSTDGSLFQASVEKTRMAEQKSGLKLSAIIWAQGENDGEAISKGIITREDYKKSLLDLISRYRNEFGESITFGIIETGRRLNDKAADKGFAIVRQVQREVAGADPNTHILYAKTDKFIEYNLMTDVVHYNQDALNLIGTEVAQNLCSVLNGEAVKLSHGAMVIAHRGASAFAPENTLSSVNLAWEMGASAVEIDIHLTADNKVVVCHDADTKRISGKDYAIAETNSDVLRTLDVGSTFSSQFSGEKIPFLHEVIATIPKGKFLFIEIKCSEKIVPFLKEEIDKSGKEDQLKIISFSASALQKSKQLMPDIPVFWLVCPPYKEGIINKLLTESDNYGFDGLDINYGLLTDETNKILKEQNRYVYVWTVNNEADAIKFDACKVYGITSDKPNILNNND